MRLVLDGMTPEAVLDVLADAALYDPRLAPLHMLARERLDGIRRVANMVRLGTEHAPRDEPDRAIAESAAMFDRLVQVSPEASVAAYSLGEADLLSETTTEIVDWMRASGLLHARPRILDLGSGIGRFASALTADADSILGLDVSSNMVAEARSRCAGFSHLRFETCSGSNLQGVPDGSFDLVLAVDVFPYLVLGGLALAEMMIAEARRVLRPHGSLLILNFSYRGAVLDRRDVRALAQSAGFDLRRDGTREFKLWDGLAFWLRAR